LAAPLPTLRAKRKRRKGQRNKQARKWRRTDKAGHGKLAVAAGKAVKKLERLIRKVLRRKPASGTGSWGGAKSIIVNEVLPVGKKWGIPVTSKKRWETYGNPGSDHYRGNKDAFAADFATDSNYAFGAALGKALGVSYSGPADDYRSFYIERAGRNFRVQVISGTHGTGPHTHVGVKRA